MRNGEKGGRYPYAKSATQRRWIWQPILVQDVPYTTDASEVRSAAASNQQDRERIHRPPKYY